MGVNIYCGKREGMDMSYSTFDFWRVELAKNLNCAFGESYRNWLFSGSCYPKEDKVRANESFEAICNSTSELTDELFEFFIMSDCEGKISSETSKQLIPLIEKLPDNYIIGYAGVSPYNKEYVLDFFKYSIKHCANIWWH